MQADATATNAISLGMLRSITGVDFGKLRSIANDTAP
jgi:hypothetical protein